MNRVTTTLTRLILKRQIKILPIRCNCDKTDKPQDSSNNVEVQQSEKSEAEQSKLQHSKEASMKKINMLLKVMLEESKKPKRSATEELTKPPGIFHKPKNVVKAINIEEKLIKAASDVAESMGEDKKQVEAELLSKVLGKINPSQSQVNLNDLVVGMKVDRDKVPDGGFKRDERAQNVMRLMSNVGGQFKQRRQTRDGISDGVFRKQNLIPTPCTSDNLFGSAPLNIFKSNKEANYGTNLDVWNAQFEKELTLSVQRHPDNYFEKMILWTNEGKIWKFPIDNEQDLEEDQEVSFTEHIFLDVHLEGWCPETGPIRHFMELVCVGLSKNPYYTVQEKKDHINWFREFFMSREKLLREVGAIPPTEGKTGTTTAEI